MLVPQPVFPWFAWNTRNSVEEKKKRMTKKENSLGGFQGFHFIGGPFFVS